MCSLNSVSFHANTCAPGYNVSTPRQYAQANFKGGYDYYGSEKKSSPIKTIGAITAILALVAIGFGYAHKTNAIDALGDGKVKDLLKKANPVLEKCHQGCSWVKNKGVEGWNTFKGWFGKKD